MSVVLRAGTASEQIDGLLRGLISLCELALPGRIRSYYLGGSTSDGTAVVQGRSPNASDVDLFVIFRGTLQETDTSIFNRLLAACQLISPIGLDAHAYAEADLLQQPGQCANQLSFLNALIKASSILVYGDDLREELPTIPFTRYVLDLIESGLFHLSIPRQTEALAYPLYPPLMPPLAYPDAAGEFYGYDLVPSRPGTPPGTRVLVGIATWIASVILALETGRYAGQKSQCMQLCTEYLPHDRRIQLVVTTYELCKGGLRYGLPTSSEERELLSELCRDTLRLENEYMRLCHDYLLAQLQHGTVDEQWHATHILQSVAWKDDAMVDALKALQHNADEAIRAGAMKALEDKLP